jgi:hypothetical protein
LCSCSRSPAGGRLPFVVRQVFYSLQRASDALDKAVADRAYWGKPMTHVPNKGGAEIYYGNGEGDALWIQKTEYDSVRPPSEDDDRSGTYG